MYRLCSNCVVVDVCMSILCDVKDREKNLNNKFFFSCEHFWNIKIVDHKIQNIFLYKGEADKDIPMNNNKWDWLALISTYTFEIFQLLTLIQIIRNELKCIFDSQIIKIEINILYIIVFKWYKSDTRFLVSTVIGI